MSFDVVGEFEQEIARFFGAPYAVAVDCCTHGLELCLRFTEAQKINVLWKRDSYISNTFMCLSFQFKKHLNLGRGGIILLDDKESYESLKKMSYDGRILNIPWRKQNITTMGYHYYMTPETAKLGLEKLPQAIKDKPVKWALTDWPDLRKMGVFE